MGKSAFCIFLCLGLLVLYTTATQWSTEYQNNFVAPLSYGSGLYSSALEDLFNKHVFPERFTAAAVTLASLQSPDISICLQELNYTYPFCVAGTTNAVNFWIEQQIGAYESLGRIFEIVTNGAMILIQPYPDLEHYPIYVYTRQTNIESWVDYNSVTNYWDPNASLNDLRNDVLIVWEKKHASDPYSILWYNITTFPAPKTFTVPGSGKRTINNLLPNHFFFKNREL